MGILAGLFAAGSALFSAVSATTVGAALFKAAIGVGINVGLGQLLGKKQKRDAQPPPRALQTDLATGADTPRDVAFGRVATRGHLTWFLETGPNNRDFNGTYVLSDGWCHGLVSVLVDGVAHDLVAQPVTGTEHARFHVDGYGSKIVLRWHDGRPGQAADSDLVAVSGGQIRVEDVADGLCYVAATIVDVANNFQSLPELTFILDGYRLYDPRQDSTVGGSGGHRLGDPTTWAPGGVPVLHNPSLMVFNYAAGIRAGSEVGALGGFAGSDGLINATFMVAGNACEEAVVTPGGGSEPRYEAAMIVKADGSDHRSKVAPMLQAMAGRAVESAGRFGVLPGTAQTPVVTFTDDDVLWDEGVEWSRFRTRDERINEVRGQHLSESAGWQFDDYPSVINTAARIEDGEDKIATFDQPHIRSATQAQRTGSIRLEESRYGQARVPLPMPFILLDAGDWVRWNSERFGDHFYWVDDIEQGEDFVVRCALQRTHPSVFGAPTLGTYTPPLPIPGPPALPTTVAGFDIDQVAVSGDNNIPALVATWIPPDDARVDAVVVEYRIVGSLQSQKETDFSPEDGEIVITGLAPGEEYEARATIRTTPLRNTEWTAWRQATTLFPPLAVPDASVALSKLDQDVQGLFAAINRLREDSLTQKDIIDDMLSTSQSVDLLERYIADQDMRAFVASESLVRTTEEQVLASLITTVSTTLNGNVADISWVQSSQDGQAVRFGILGNINGETGGFQFQGIQLDGEVSYTFEVDGDLIVDGSVTADKLQANELSALSANLGTVTAGRIESTNGVMLIDADNGIIRITA